MWPESIVNETSRAPLPVLCIGADEAGAMLLGAVMRLRPHLRLMLARDGATASRLAPHLRPALVIVKAWLPDCPGGELVSLLRLRHGWGPVPAVALTQPAQPCADTAFVDIWLEPLDARVVLPFLDRWLPVPPAFPAPAGGGGAARPPLRDPRTGGR